MIENKFVVVAIPFGKNRMLVVNKILFYYTAARILDYDHFSFVNLPCNYTTL